MGLQGPMQAVCGRILVRGSAAVCTFKHRAVLAPCSLGWCLSAISARVPLGR
uniref:Uncharacterized protein n=1 Tax=bacterium enrichment culture clone 1(2010) TaxID=795322 RepID=D9CGI9_9BACT|nr:hypothetical protein pHB1_gp06 [bacterium enrichment culture clone 1(2010)]